MERLAGLGNRPLVLAYFLHEPRHAEAKSEPTDPDEKEKTMATYQWELGINTATLDSSNKGTIQVGFVNTTNVPTVAYPANIQPGDNIIFYVFDTGSKNGSTSSISAVTLTVSVTANGQSIQLLTPQPSNASPSTQSSGGYSFTFGGGNAATYYYWGFMSSSVATGASGLYSLTFTINGNVPSGTTPISATWVKDPEMMVGGWG